MTSSEWRALGAGLLVTVLMSSVVGAQHGARLGAYVGIAGLLGVLLCVSLLVLARRSRT